MNAIDNRSIVYAKQLLRLELAELNELMRLGAGIPGDEYRIGIITGLLGRRYMNVPVKEARPVVKEDVHGHKHASDHYSSRLLLGGGGWYGRGRWFEVVRRS